MHKILFLTILFLFTGCFYKYSSKSLGLTTHLYFPSGEFHDSYKELFFSIPDSLIDTSSNIFYLGICAQVHIRILTYSSKKKLNDTLFNKCIINNRLINEKKDSLKEEGIRFTSFATGGGRRLKVKNPKNIYLEDTTFLKISDIIIAKKNDQNFHSIVKLIIKKDGTTRLYPKGISKKQYIDIIIKDDITKIEESKTIYKRRHRLQLLPF